MNDCRHGVNSQISSRTFGDAVMGKPCEGKGSGHEAEENGFGGMMDLDYPGGQSYDGVENEIESLRENVGGREHGEG